MQQSTSNDIQMVHGVWIEWKTAFCSNGFPFPCMSLSPLACLVWRPFAIPIMKLFTKKCYMHKMDTPALWSGIILIINNGPIDSIRFDRRRRRESSSSSSNSNNQSGKIAVLYRCSSARDWTTLFRARTDATTFNTIYEFWIECRWWIALYGTEQMYNTKLHWCTVYTSVWVQNSVSDKIICTW